MTDTNRLKPRANALGKARPRRQDPTTALAGLVGPVLPPVSDASLPTATEKVTNKEPVAAEPVTSYAPEVQAQAREVPNADTHAPGGGTDGPASSGGNPRELEADQEDVTTRADALERRQETAEVVSDTGLMHDVRDGLVDLEAGRTVPAGVIEVDLGIRPSPRPVAAPVAATAADADLAPPREAAASARAQHEGRQRGGGPPGAAEADDTFQTSVYLPALTRGAVRRESGKTGKPLAEIAMDAIDWTLKEGVLQALVDRQHTEPREEGSVFPARRTRRSARRKSSGQPRKVLMQVFFTDAELEVLDGLKEDYGAHSRSVLVGVAIDAYFYPPSEKELRQYRYKNEPPPLNLDTEDGR